MSLRLVYKDLHDEAWGCELDTEWWTCCLGEVGKRTRLGLPLSRIAWRDIRW